MFDSNRTIHIWLVRVRQICNLSLTAQEPVFHQLISADTFKDERRPEAPAHYKVTVRVDRTSLTDRQRQLEIRPGMQADVELHTGSKTVLQYLTKPLLRGQEALREP